MRYSIVIPVHNEASHLERSVTEFLACLPDEIGACLTEVLLVENGSRDDTLAACYRLEEKFSAWIRVLSVGRPSYGEAIKQGMLASTGTHVSILECDFLDAGFVSASIRAFKEGAVSFLVASKRHPDSVDRRPVKRRILTAVYNRVLLRFFLGYPGSDTHGLKSIEAGWAKRLCSLAVTSDEIFQTEIVLLGWRLGLEIRETPIRIEERRPAPIAVARRVPKIVGTVLQLRRSLNRFPKRAECAPGCVLTARLPESEGL